MPDWRNSVIAVGLLLDTCLAAEVIERRNAPPAQSCVQSEKILHLGQSHVLADGSTLWYGAAAHPYGVVLRHGGFPVPVEPEFEQRFRIGQAQYTLTYANGGLRIEKTDCALQ